jgi:anti-repressor protein
MVSMVSGIQPFNVTVKDDNLMVSGRELHEKLEVETPYTMWFQRMCEYGFTEGVDFNPHNFVKVQYEGNREVERSIIDHQLSISMAKELCMIQRSSIGKMFREYFIRIEADWNSPHKLMARALIAAQGEIDRRDARIAVLEPKGLFADAVSASSSCILVRDLAKFLKQNGVEIGQNRLFELLREEGYLCKPGSGSYNQPTQRSMDMGLFRVIEHTVNSPGKPPHITLTPKVTGKGQQYFINHFLSERKAG